MSLETLFITHNSPFNSTKLVKQPNGSPQNLTGYTAEMVLQQYLGDDTKYSMVGVIPTPISGIVNFSIHSNSTALLPRGNMFYSIYLYPPAPADKIMLETGIAKVIGAP